MKILAKRDSIISKLLPTCSLQTSKENEYLHFVFMSTFIKVIHVSILLHIVLNISHYLYEP